MSAANRRSHSPLPGEELRAAANRIARQLASQPAGSLSANVVSGTHPQSVNGLWRCPPTMPLLHKALGAA